MPQRGSPLGAQGLSDKKLVADGGQDGGGGNTIFSSKEEVEATIQKTIQLFMDPGFLKPQHPLRLFYTRFVSKRASIFKSADAMKYGTKDLSRIIQAVFDSKKIIEGQEDVDLSRSTNMDSSGFPFSYLQKSKFVLKENGTCESSDNKHADASVDSFEIGAEICFSVESLRRIPSEVLFAEISSLFMHELAHLNGFSEKDAQSVQLAFRAHIGDMYGIKRTNWNRESLKESYTNAALALDEILKNGISESGRLVNERVIIFGAANIRTQIIEATKLLGSSSDVQYRLNPSHPELYDELARLLVSARIALELSSGSGVFGRERNVDVKLPENVNFEPDNARPDMFLKLAGWRLTQAASVLASFLEGLKVEATPPPNNANELLAFDYLTFPTDLNKSTK